MAEIGASSDLGGMVAGENEGEAASRVLVCAMRSATLLSEVVKTHAGLELVERLVDPDDLEAAILRTGATSVVLGADVRDPVGRCRHLLERFPGLSVLALCDAERSGVLLRADRPALALRDLSLRELLNSISAPAAPTERRSRP